MKRHFLGLALTSAIFLPGSALAFCGTYVGSAGDTILNQASQVVFVREGKRTTITMANDFSAAGTTFGLLIPVPGDFDPSDLREFDMGTVERVDAYAAPRLVEYTCEDLHGGSAKDAGCACAGALATSLLAGLALDALPGFLDEVGLARAELQLDTLAPQTVEALSDALALNGFVLSEDAAGLLEEYIAAGSGFIQVKVDLPESNPAAALWLPPLQFSYRSETASLPIRLGALNGVGTQDLILHTITGPGDGAMGISNFPEVTVESECMWKEDGLQTFSGYYEEKLQEAFEASGGQAAWIREYTWSPTACDPCTGGGPLDAGLLSELGYRGDPSVATLSRLHLRYDPSAVSGDLMLYATNTISNQQIRFIAHDTSLESDFPLCEEGWLTDGGSCEDDTASSGVGLRFAPGWLVLAAGLLGWGRRRTSVPV
jgi:hypothetical protein